MDAVTNVPLPQNEPVLSYAPGSAEREELVAKLEELGKESIDLPMRINGESRMGGGEPIDVVQPHRHAAVLGTMRNATHDDARAAVAAAKAAAPAWRAMSFDDRAAILLRAADLLAGPWRATINAATMLGQSKTAQQAEIDAACELIDFWRFNVSYARELIAQQPLSVRGVWNRMEQRPLEGFVYAITPFNFTAIAGNLPTAPALMGNVVVWKPSPTQQFAAELTMRLLEEAGMPPGVINMVTGDGLAVSDVALNDPELAGVHFTGSTKTFQHLWKSVGENISSYRSYPRIVGETGGKDFIVAHSSADPEVLRTAIVRGAFEYQGQKCSAASRAFVARSVWEQVRDDLVAETEALTMGDVTDLSNFIGAVIDRRSFDKLAKVLKDAESDPTLEIIAGGTADDSVGYFVRPTIIEGTDPTNDVFRTEYFGPVIAVHVYEDDDFDDILKVVDEGSAYALTGAILAKDRSAIARATEALRFSAGNFYVNDRPTGSIVGQQPFGGGRASGTNDKAGSAQNLSRWSSPRAIKETFVAPTVSSYPHQG
ncbi:L-glutamate gamma-semialdehyde dehydrogenase [Nocardiopsis tropica]|jgi:1-pyrroline-5-carboxylate dehydrogenase|uniref:L-glutamate gamma-semialdehyde dehydrogenase n=1 Tax=Nocardiopsis tropica TaxID=109330 RepID=A0ABU7KWY8_9ACTN|nr:L-glutamate gamma-semialdehyde dehydrogenase [Nocardiopsis umidischolae]MEE2053830.1 L-glutamate gamma-semialdehyde dehydrogenase [Nocardiopsis umidischolae]